MKIGYACLALGVPNTTFRTCRLANAHESRLLDLITHNLQGLENLIDYNNSVGIRLFRITSNLIPFGSSPVNEIPWWDVFSPRLAHIAQKIKDYDLRVSVHPGQYTVLNSPNPQTVERAIKDLEYHYQILKSLECGLDSKIILHIGGIYNQKKQAIKRFKDHFLELSPEIQKHLVIENDDKYYTIQDVLTIGRELKIPVVFDNLHHQLNSDQVKQDELFWIKECATTWQDVDGRQKIHYSQQDPKKRAGAHSKTISTESFMDFYHLLAGLNVDIMLEVKDKNLSALKCNNLLDNKITLLEQEWSRYKYLVLEKSPTSYLAVRQLLKNKNNYPVQEFYQLIDQSLQEKTTIGNGVNAALHIWGYFKEVANTQEKRTLLNMLEKYQQGKSSLQTVKNFLWKLTLKYEEEYLQRSYFFFF